MGTLGSVASSRCGYRAYLDCCWDNKFFSEYLTKRNSPGKWDIQRTNPSSDCIGRVIYWSDSSSRGVIQKEISGGMVLLVSAHLWHPNRNELLGRNGYRRLVDYLFNLQERRIPREQKGTRSEACLKYHFGSTFLGWNGGEFLFGLYSTSLTDSPGIKNI